MRHTTLWSCTHIPNIIDLPGKTKKLWSGQASLRRSRSGRKIRIKQYVSFRLKRRHNKCPSPLTLVVQILLRGVLDTTLCDKGQCLATGQWFSRGTPVSSTNKTEHHDIAEILLNEAKQSLTRTTTISKQKIKMWWSTIPQYIYLKNNHLSPQTIEHKKRLCMTYGFGNPIPGLRRAQKCGWPIHVNGIQTLPLYFKHILLFKKTQVKQLRQSSPSLKIGSRTTKQK